MKLRINNDIRHFRWLVDSRHKNQLCAIELFGLLQKHARYWQKNSFTAQALVGATFALWRAAFLADRTGNHEMVLKSAQWFLKQVIETNAITFSNDRDAKEWTFNYYVNSARYTLDYLTNRNPDIVRKWKNKKRSSKERWNYAQDILTDAVDKFALKLRRRAHGL